MTFAEWLEREGRGAMTRVHHATRISYPTLAKAKKGDPMTPALAKAISGATRGEVSVDTLERGVSSDVAPAEPPKATGTDNR